jgi:hypothetical protein
MRRTRTRHGHRHVLTSVRDRMEGRRNEKNQNHMDMDYTFLSSRHASDDPRNHLTIVVRLSFHIAPHRLYSAAADHVRRSYSNVVAGKPM